MRFPRYFPLLLGACFIFYALSFLFPLMGQILMSVGGLDARLAPLVMAGGFLLSALLQPMAGKRLDGPQARLVLAAAILATSAGVAGLLFRPTSLPVLVMLLAAFLAGTGVLSTAASKCLEGDVPSELRGQASSLFGAAINLGFGVSALLAYFWLPTHGRTLLVLDAVSAAVYGLVLFRQFGKPREVAALSTERIHYSASDYRAFLAVFLLFFTMVAPLSATSFLFRQIGLEAARFTAATFGVNNVIIVVAGLVLSTGWGNVAPTRQLWLSTILLGLGNALMPTVASVPVNSFYVTLWSLGEVLAYPVIARAIYSRFPGGRTGQAAGVKGFLFSASLVAGPLATAVLQHCQPWAFSFVFGGAPLVALWLLRERRVA